MSDTSAITHEWVERPCCRLAVAESDRTEHGLLIMLEAAWVQVADRLALA
jgi:hypothetical protein